MLSALRQRVSLVPRLAPAQICRVSMISIQKAQEDEAIKVLDEIQAPAAPEEQPMQTVVQQRADLDVMHHHIPPAQSPILQLFISWIMKDGKRATAAKRISDMLLRIHIMTQSQPLPIVEAAVERASPAVWVSRMKKGGGKTIVKPKPLNERQRASWGVYWIMEGANKKGRPGKDIADRLAREIIAVLQDTPGEPKVWANMQKKRIHEEALTNRGNLAKR
ncbi:30S ribosomal protein S7 [Psilocybe cubensis]|uniref:30S ribosomal protein S7 n=2 Tax=Psilocybe cubensis TaxID=181762 RepID=A0ACB8GYM4_PSICU|nr:30S ribosomal protein S7 [Psilocybe cubensis]KAH9480684.1 30S ribosomal protein S7 [Psilocybe cubensis]